MKENIDRLVKHGLLEHDESTVPDYGDYDPTGLRMVDNLSDYLA